MHQVQVGGAGTAAQADKDAVVMKLACLVL